MEEREQLTGCQKYYSHPTAAKVRGVSTRTLDRWVKAGIIRPPIRINQRKYHRAEDIEAIGNTA
jgi:predicted site-specific integrase-resolvase